MKTGTQSNVFKSSERTNYEHDVSDTRISRLILRTLEFCGGWHVTGPGDPKSNQKPSPGLERAFLLVDVQHVRE